MRHYIIRNKLYEEELCLIEGISQQVCVDVTYNQKPVTLYSTHRENGYLVSDELIAEDVIQKSHAKLIVYVHDDKIALEIAKKWCNKEEQKKKGYQVLGIDSNYSIFD